MELHDIRRAHRLKVGGMSNKAVAEKMGVSSPTVAKMLGEYHERRLAGTLFNDQARDVDLYSHPATGLNPRKSAR